jgi:phosphoribosylaminoimidazole-succinocarboxamide synthase
MLKRWDVMGSVKDLTVIKKAEENEAGTGVFRFTDDYSVFDYGKMPDVIPQKGESLCRMAAYNFEETAKRGIKSHFRRLVSGNEMEVSLFRVLYPQKNEIKEGMSNYLIPLEVMFRNLLPEGSSLLRRFREGEAKPEDYGLEKMPEPDEKLREPIIDVSTKLESTDRHISWEEAAGLAHISGKEAENIRSTALEIDSYLNEKAESLGLVHADGKIELAFTPKRELVVVDVFGTLDENRFLYNGVHLSKQVARDYYTGKQWHEELEKAKAEGKSREEWPVPEKLPPELVTVFSDMYKSICEAWTGKKVWNAPSLDSVMDAYRSFIDKMQ